VYLAPGVPAFQINLFGHRYLLSSSVKLPFNFRNYPG